MRQYKKRQLLDALKQLYAVHQYVKELEISGREKGMQQCSKEQQEALGECQSVAITVGNIMEESVGTGTRTVQHLEEYCELLYQTVSGGMLLIADAGQKYEKLDEKLRQAKRSLEREVKEEIVAVFLPYKASMWDALESIWQAAAEDEKCTAYVVPVPYYDKNKDGSLGKKHYEGGRYPSYVPVTSYEDLSLEELHPDLIFIHNPYDQFNTVTSVEPAFYASELRKYTDRLVYIPYFVTGESVPRHFCVLPGTLFADYVIVENEEVRRIYIEEYEAMTGKRDGEARFLALGSPKYDKVETSERAKMEIPEEWQKVIKGRKVIFYNTTVHTLLNEPEKAVKKIRQVIQTFKEHKEAVLLWRPHPLSLAALRSQKPELEDAYARLVEEYKKSGIGIYDDTPDMERAIMISDAYYGDYGSVPVLYKHTGKPMMFQNLDTD